MVDSRAIEIAEAPKVTLATPEGLQDFAVPKLVVIQAMKALPAIGRALPALARIMTLRRKLPSLFAAANDDPSASFEFISELALTESEYTGMVDAIFWGIVGGLPTMTDQQINQFRERFNQFKIPPFSAAMAFMTVVQQSDLFEFGPPKPNGGAAPGEVVEGDRPATETSVAALRSTGAV
jgi:hypothetical protein